MGWLRKPEQTRFSLMFKPHLVYHPRYRHVQLINLSEPIIIHTCWVDWVGGVCGCDFLLSLSDADLRRCFMFWLSQHVIVAQSPSG